MSGAYHQRTLSLSLSLSQLFRMSIYNGHTSGASGKEKKIGEKKKSERSLPKCSRSWELGAGCRMTGPAS